MQRNKTAGYLITSSARAMNVGVSPRPSRAMSLEIKRFPPEIVNSLVAFLQ